MDWLLPHTRHDLLVIVAITQERLNVYVKETGTWMYQLVLKLPCLTHDLVITLLSLHNSFLFLHCAAAGRCNAETTEFLSWPNTPAGTTQTLCCPNTTTMISRTCSLSGVWESVDPSLCTSLALINTVSFSVGFRLSM